MSEMDDAADGPREVPAIRWDVVRAYGRGQVPADELTEAEMEAATDGLDALDWG